MLETEAPYDSSLKLVVAPVVDDARIFVDVDGSPAGTSSAIEFDLPFLGNPIGRYGAPDREASLLTLPAAATVYPYPEHPEIPGILFQPYNT